MLVSHFPEDISEVRRQRQVATFVQLIVLQTRPFAVDFTAAYAVADDEHRIRMSVIGPAIPILSDSTTKLRHRENENVIHASAKIRIQRGNRRAELSQQIAKLALLIAFVNMRVPA